MVCTWCGFENMYGVELRRLRFLSWRGILQFVRGLYGINGVTAVFSEASKLFPVCVGSVFVYGYFVDGCMFSQMPTRHV